MSEIHTEKVLNTELNPSLEQNKLPADAKEELSGRPSSPSLSNSTSTDYGGGTGKASSLGQSSSLGEEFKSLGYHKERP